MELCSELSPRSVLKGPAFARRAFSVASILQIDTSRQVRNIFRCYLTRNYSLDCDEAHRL